MNITFGKKLREERKRQRLTVLMIAQSCGISRSYVTLIENGKRLPGKNVLPKIASSLHLKTAEVLNWYLEDIGHRLHEGLETSQI